MIQESESRIFTIERAYKAFMNIEWSRDLADLKTYVYAKWDNHLLKSIVEDVKSGKLTTNYLRCISTSVEDERLFSKLNNLLSCNRPFKKENIIKYFYHYWKS